MAIRLSTLAIALGVGIAAIGAGYKDRLYPYAAFVLPLDQKPAATIPELAVDGTVSLGAVKGRIDHLAIDLERKRLFVAELGNHSVGVVDLQRRELETRLTGFDEPQGVAFIAKADRLAIANGGNGVVEIRRGAHLSVAAKIALGGDADNVRIDEEGQIIVGYGDGGLAVLDAATGEKREDIKLAAHPEGFQLDPGGQRIFVNEPEALRVGVIDRQSGKETARWSASGAAANFPMAFDADGHRLFIAYRIPALITMFDTNTGELVDRGGTCGDADDIFYDKSRTRLYVVCGDGSIAVLAISDHLQELSRLATRRGARTGLFVPERDELFVAVPASGSSPAEIRVYRPH